MSESGQNTTNEKELSLGLLRQRRALILISIILLFFIFGVASIENFELLNGIKINIEKLPVEPILWVLFAYFWMRYWQHSKVGIHRKTLENEKVGDIARVRKEFSRKMACNNIKECFDAEKRFDVKKCFVKEIEYMPSAWLSFPKRQKLEIYQYEIQDKIVSLSKNLLDHSPSEIEKIERNGWELVKSNNSNVLSKTFTYNWFKLKCTLCWVKLKFYWHSTYFTDYLLPHYLAAAALLSFCLSFYYLPYYWLIYIALFLIGAVVKECFWTKV